MRTVFLIDGFNFYHSIKSLPPKFHWIDYLEFCKNFLLKSDTLESVNYFTALAKWIDGAEKRHMALIDACKLKGINVIFGKFKRKEQQCPLCNKVFHRHEEKATDVNIALYAYRFASFGLEKIVFVTGDTDMIPSINLIRNDFPNVKVGVIFPYERHNRELKNKACFSYKTRLDLLEKCLLPPILTKPNGKKIVCPKEWA